MKTKVLMVCLGNICRSPLAEGILRSKVNITKITVDSAGTGGWHVGEQPDPRSIKVAKKYGLDITYQRGRKFSTYDFETYDHIFVMDNSNYQDVIKLAKNNDEIAKVRLILDEIFPDENVDVPDPYYGGAFGFENVFKMLDEACEKIAARL
ncbi:MAG: low molecular weight phosphotyrosine protein phosphatase [Bacteroidia bacterium]|nr:low molecular weight phosphotyrosine protein phosphatase [Bacteroidia bacterium]NNF30260.1 low molecular weight phosphotyrosine protein phosphatase [Flavobacteriaceae bacterium]MBT8277331.1 low molecular weight phosphotyrosine protein phosphatase [Bacteroidia bacterium]NNJ82810.1 low molecular weight phosphotyrosine protein phosphatase [Flavobacteriaceae bacterium]NNK54267.1 low molecular weight phosphotyrosine protein phosphatase [Flavobacteriaceae bacterium]